MPGRISGGVIMSEERPLFILAGNGPYSNRGCEAIVRGTVKILREHFRDPRFICLSHIQSEEQYRNQCSQETDNAISHISSHLLSKGEAIHNFWKPETWLYLFRHITHSASLKYRVYSDMLPHLDDASAVLSVGGDNYSLDYGLPALFTGLDDIVLEKGKPIAIWGASVGPFSKMPDYEKYMSIHLRQVTGIFARESATIDYLKGINVAENVYPVADPAFLMDPTEPDGIKDSLPIDDEAIGINLSPLMAKYVTGGNLDAWVSMAASLIEDVARKTEMPVYLIPHVTNPISNDYEFMKKAASLIQSKECRITLVPPEYSASELKWIISRMSVFAGARTHSTIAALSSGVPTLSFAYSIKARGINRDIFGHVDYCLEPASLDKGSISGRIGSMLDNSDTIRRDLAEHIPMAQKSALSSGMRLKQIIG
jgi:colanic acid/amylovoran biosynthesis protein